MSHEEAQWRIKQRQAAVGAVGMSADVLMSLVAKLLNLRAKEEMRKAINDIRSAQARDPALGALVHVAWKTAEPTSTIVKNNLAISPQAAFQYVWVYYDTAKERAVATMRQRPKNFEDRGTPLNSRFENVWHDEIHWINPLQPMLKPTGWWKVRLVGTNHVWHYHFLESGEARWADPSTGEGGGGGRWVLNQAGQMVRDDPLRNNIMRVNWSGSTEEWKYPLKKVDQEGATNWGGRQRYFVATFGVAPPQPKPPSASPVGRWLVRCQQWTWVYIFSANGTVQWSEAAGHRSGTGKWKMHGGNLLIQWNAEQADVWKLPLNASGTQGTTLSGGKTYGLTATRS